MKFVWGIFGFVSFDLPTSDDGVQSRRIRRLDGRESDTTKAITSAPLEGQLLKAAVCCRIVRSQWRFMSAREPHL